MRKVTLLVALLGAAAGCADEPPPSGTGPVAPSLAAGDAILEVAPDGGLALRRLGAVLLTLPADGLVLGTVSALDDDLSYDPYWLEHEDELFTPDPPDDLVWRAPRTATVLEALPDAALRIELDYGGGLTARLHLQAAGDGSFAATWTPTIPEGLAVAWMRLRARVPETEAFYGLGEWPDRVEHRGTLRPMQLALDTTVESASNENHVPVPLLVGTSGFGLFVASDRPGVFDVARKDPAIVEATFGTAGASGEGLAFHLYAAPHPLDVTRLYYETTGYPRLPAPWALGPWIWRDESRDQAEVLEDVRAIRDLDLATSAIWIDRPYASAVNAFDFDPALYPDPAGMIAAIRAAGLRVALWHTPYLEEATGPLLAEAQEAGYFPPEVGTVLNGWGPPIDLTNPAAYAFWQANVRRYTDLGIEGFKLDYAEDVIPGVGGGRSRWRFADGSDERTMHRGYTLLYHRVYAETLPEDSGFLLCRAGRWGDQVNASVIWPGDMDASFTAFREPFTPRGRDREVVGVGGLPATVAQGIGLGASGFPFFGADTGGYRHSPPDEELYIRWFQQTALSTVMQVGDSSSQPPWVYTEENGRSARTLELYRAYARLHLRLFPYEWTYAQRLREDGRPIQRALGLAYPELGKHPSDQYLLGDELLVAPVLERGATSRRVIFPPGRWRHWLTGAVHDGGEAGTEEEVPAPLEELPLFVREGGIVPMLRPTIDTLSPATDPGVDSFANDAGTLWVRVAPGRGLFELWDGTSIRQDDGQVELAGGSVFDQGFVVELFGAAEPSEVALDGAPLTRRETLAEVETAGGWTFDPAAGGSVWAAAPAGGTLTWR